MRGDFIKWLLHNHVLGGLSGTFFMLIHFYSSVVCLACEANIPVVPVSIGWKRRLCTSKSAAMGIWSKKSTIPIMSLVWRWCTLRSVRRAAGDYNSAEDYCWLFTWNHIHIWLQDVIRRTTADSAHQFSLEIFCEVVVLQNSIEINDSIFKQEATEKCFVS